MSERSNKANSIENLRQEIDHCDNAILEYIKRRTDASRTVGKIRAAEGGPRIIPSREEQIRGHYAVLGDEGVELANILLRLGRGPDEYN